MFVKNNLVVIFVLIIGIVLGTGYIIVFPTINNWNFEIERVFGDKKLLDDVYISGEIMDRYSLTEFSIGAEKNTVNFMPFKNTDHFDFYFNRKDEANIVVYTLGDGNYINLINLSEGGVFNCGIYDYWISSSWDGKIDVYRVKKRGERREGVTIDTNIEKRRIETTPYSNNYITDFEDRLFFIPPVAAVKSSDELYIYELLDFAGEMNYKKVANIPLENGMGPVREIFSIGDSLIIRMRHKLINFNVDTGEFTDQFIIQENYENAEIFIYDDLLIITSSYMRGRLKRASAYKISGFLFFSC
ncbi:hypothetical protein RBH29_01315 [Herbivorax sp. ANBcel31]|uniref:hypothetical protein n=1 Tax=Herbivorax sp. ANBcel31 TaxID=3069754 RepID=UPI0027B73DEA|nr:hypothetical protein [Herbivorax sp. ANBcel31]MDQ2085077.1 hypothetical protein [Herbivorax sp. ANBcel31]